MDLVQKNLLEQVAGLHEVPEGAYNIRANGKKAARNTTANIDIVTKEDKDGIDIIIKPGTINESVHIPVVLSESGLQECVYNDFYIGEGADVTIVAGCGIHNCGVDTSKHEGIHTFYLEKNAKVKYIERHYGEGDGNGENIMNPQTIVHLKEGDLADGASLEVHEKIMTHGKQYAKTDFAIDMNGKDCSCNLVSRSVAKGESRQEFFSIMNGNAACAGHSECDAIIMDHGCVTASPQLTANNIDANLIHEAAIGKIAGEQLIKLMTLGLTEKEAEEQIINGFLK